jgi:amphi-Trp domain-containing protein
MGHSIITVRFVVIRNDRDIEKSYPKAEFVTKLRRLANAIEHDKKFGIQIAGERIYVPVQAELNIEHGREDGHEEIAFRLSGHRKTKILAIFTHFKIACSNPLF